MLQHLIIPLSDNSVSFCHYEGGDNPNIISSDVLKGALFWAMKHNLSIHVLYPRTPIPTIIAKQLEEIPHSTIIPSDIEDQNVRSQADIIVFDGWTDLKGYHFPHDCPIVIRTTIDQILTNENLLLDLLARVDRANVVITDIANVSNLSLKSYDSFLHRLIQSVIKQFLEGHNIQINLLTDRLILNYMNNCNAGSETITLAPDGKFYICPGFYLNKQEDVGDIQNGLKIRNAELYKLTHAPICRNCDAFQCKRCVWLNKILTGEINTPSHEQCVVSHLERNASREFLKVLREINVNYLPEQKIPEIDYLDPIMKLTKKL